MKANAKYLLEQDILKTVSFFEEYETIEQAYTLYWENSIPEMFFLLTDEEINEIMNDTYKGEIIIYEVYKLLKNFNLNIKDFLKKVKYV